MYHPPAATKSKVHNTADGALFQNVRLLAQSLARLIDNRDVTNPGYVLIIYAVLCKCMLLFLIPV